MSTYSSSSREELMFLGTTCNHPDCNLNDFLPFACPACHLPFCQPHFLPSVHQCKSPLPPSMVDRIAPQCPMCNEVVPYPPGGRLDPNEAVERHIAGGCEAMEGGAARKKAVLRQKKAQGKVCFKRGCSKSLIVEMRCVDCGRNFCPSHRHGKEHDCKGVAAAGSGNTRPGSKTAGSRLLNMGSLGSKLPSVGSNSTPGVKTNAASSKSTGVKTPTVPVTQAAGEALDARAAAAAAALKRAGGNVKVPFVKTKTEKRVADQEKSREKALAARKEKGLLSKADEVRYAEMVAKKEASRRKGEDKDGCVIA